MYENPVTRCSSTKGWKGTHGNIKHLIYKMGYLMSPC